MTDHHRRDPLGGDDIGMMRVQPMLVGLADGQQSARHRLVGRGPHDVDIQRDDLPTPVR
jgi:hypothetical protein